MTGWRATSAFSVACLVVGLVAGRMAAPAPGAAETNTTASSSSVSTLAAAETSRELTRKDVVTTTTVKPDGTKTTVVQDHSVDSAHSSEKMSQSTASRSASTTGSVVFSPQRSMWSLGLSYAPTYAISPLPYNPKAFTPSIGYRLVGGLWVEAAFQIGSGTPTLGIRFEF